MRTSVAALLVAAALSPFVAPHAALADEVQTIDSVPTADFDARFERQSNPDELIDRAHASLKR